MGDLEFPSPFEPSEEINEELSFGMGIFINFGVNMTCFTFTRQI